MSAGSTFILSVSLIICSMVAGYAARRYRLVSEAAARNLMTLVVVFGYTPVGFLTIWQLAPHATTADYLLPLFGAAHVLAMLGVGLLAGRWMRLPRDEEGLLGLAASSGNNGATMGGFVIYQLFGEAGLGRSNFYSMMWTPTTVLVLYPVARRYAGDASAARLPLGRLMLECLWDWRAIGLPLYLAALAMGLAGVKRPAFVDDWHVIDILVYVVIVLAYFAIGLRLHLGGAWALRRKIAALAVLRFLVAAGVGGVFVAISHLTPWPMTGVTKDVFILQAFVPTAVTVVAVVNMFGLKAKEASVLFVVNTLMYLLLVLPVVLLLYG